MYYNHLIVNNKLKLLNINFEMLNPLGRRDSAAGDTHNRCDSLFIRMNVTHYSLRQSIVS